MDPFDIDDMPFYLNGAFAPPPVDKERERALKYIRSSPFRIFFCDNLAFIEIKDFGADFCAIEGPGITNYDGMSLEEIKAYIHKKLTGTGITWKPEHGG